MSYISLRELIIETLSHSGYGTRSENEKSLEETAASAGVLPETLIEARARRKAREALAGKDAQGKVGAGKYKYHTYTVGLSEEALVFWDSYSIKRGIHPATFVRSILHAYLRSEDEPEIRGKRWAVNGVFYGGKYAKKKVNITYAAKTLLHIRAQARGVAASTLVRALMIETAEGKRCKPGTFDIVSRDQMFTDVERYCVPADAAGAPKSMRFEGQAPLERLVESYGHDEM